MSEHHAQLTAGQRHCSGAGAQQPLDRIQRRCSDDPQADDHADRGQRAGGTEDQPGHGHSQPHRKRRRHGQAPQKGLAGGSLPGRMHTKTNQCRERQGRNEEDGVEVRRPHGDLAHAQRIQKQRIERAEELRRGGHHQQNVVHQQEGFARDQAKASLHRQVPGPNGIKDQRATRYHAQKQQNEQPTGRIGGKRVHGDQDPGANHEPP